ncbi:Peptidase S54, rhomboid domain containing protein [uncultured Desulfobacterium sp.]|uniref:Peptidase S54, rhomboid domain containing protein n=1 Tax=uncultured Desulfobacterium sp. TaxID=201089 RepID=A0A445N153_9BACT|nr:Peptidase S54, rhomboid domain containing protein [uncultured Desulfobacterium sp.]
MIPIRDTVQSRRYPVINITIIAVNVFAYLIEMSSGDQLNRFLFLYGLVPARYSVPFISDHFTFGQQAFSFLSFMFLHGGFLHLLGNMWSLYIFGDNVEDRLGPMRYLVFYLLSGFASGLCHLFFNLESQVPTIGASGAIAGVMGAYFILYPKSRILTLIPIIFIPYFVELPAYFFLGIWFLIQFFSAAGASSQAGGIAWWAHIGGFIFGIIFLKLLLNLPQTGISDMMNRRTYKTKTPKLQVIQTIGSDRDYHLYGAMAITPQEAFTGTTKMVNIPWGFQKRLFRVNVPPGITEATTLRLAGLGKRAPDNTRGDLLLKIVIKE